MKLGDATTNIFEVFSGKNQYQIPFYQRRYVWDDANWRPLWEDIILLPKKHFAGTIITYEQANNSIEIVDGQQRLTTFQIIFCVIRDLWVLQPGNRTLDQEETIAEINRYIECDPRSKKPRIVPANRDKKAFDLVVKSPNSECPKDFKSLQDSEEHLIITAYKFFEDKITIYLDHCEDGEKLQALENLSDTLKEFRLIHAQLDSVSGYDPEEIFQIINDTGRMLDDFDYIRNYLFLRTKKYLQNEDVTKNEDVAKELDTLYNNHWDKFEDWDSKKLNLFFQAFLMAKLGPTCFDGENKDIQPFDCYRKHIKIIEKGQDQKFSPLLQLSCYADSYEKLNSPPTSFTEGPDLRKLGHRMRFYDDLQLPRLDWFLLFMKHSSELSDEDLNKLCNILESYIVHSWLCSGKYEYSYEHIINFCSQEVNCKPNVQKFVNYLSEHWPDPAQVEKILRADADFVAHNLILYILYRIEPLPSSTESTLFNFGDKKINKLVEPASIYWELLAEVDEGKSDYNRNQLESEVKKIANSIGNITSEAAESDVDWNIAKICQRTDQLLEAFNRIWEPKAEDLKS